ncbi:MAG: hypothetical protein HC939_03340 [Pleurocapsa sp. SU_5_0]|nr:hypothetical protein [Pleurocapsa sp. SU_5_0]NJO96853.1 hypothetical protein [Pleurocapsa sp. CRU_1_2]NJR45073.1 hypothetical protein [Hyellaceae cyanobacterium CSU_1_1]
MALTLVSFLFFLLLFVVAIFAGGGVSNIFTNLGQMAAGFIVYLILVKIKAVSRT